MSASLKRESVIINILICRLKKYISLRRQRLKTKNTLFVIKTKQLKKQYNAHYLFRKEICYCFLSETIIPILIKSKYSHISSIPCPLPTQSHEPMQILTLNKFCALSMYCALICTLQSPEVKGQLSKNN